MHRDGTEMERMLRDWVKRLGDKTCELWERGAVKKDRWGTEQFRLVVGNHTHLIQMRSRPGEKSFTAQHLAVPETAKLVNELRARANATAWPLIINLRIQHDRSWRAVSIDDMGIAGCMPRSRGRHEDGKGIDDLIEASQIIGAICRPSNRPIRAWSTQDNMIGAEYVSILGIHARTEAEAVLKKLFNMFGVQSLRDIRDGKPLPKEDWLTRVRFIAADLEDLDTNPMGRVVTGGDALAEIEDMRALLTPQNDDGPSF